VTDATEYPPTLQFESFEFRSQSDEAAESELAAEFEEIAPA
jgi:hypothetical protein